MKFSEIHTVYFIGIGGIGMSALARYFKSQGKVVSGYDKTETDLTIQLVKEGIKVHYTDLGDEVLKKLDKTTSLIIYKSPPSKSIFNLIPIGLEFIYH